MAYTMKDVARRAGVSPATVSRVLSKTHPLSAATTARVLKVINDLGYYRNVHARRLSTGQSDLYGLVISEIANPFFSEVIRGFQAAAWEQGFDVLLLNTEYSQDRTEAVIRKLIVSDVRGAAIMTSSIRNEDVSALTKAGIGVVFSNLSPTAKLVSNIRIDYSKGIAQAIDHVESLGHRRTAVIAGPQANGTAANIKKALVHGLTRKGMKPSAVAHSDYRVDAGASAVQSILAVKSRPTVLFCGSDLIAMGAMNALEEAGLKVPDDISVLGIDDIAYAFLARPPLTTIRVPREQLGKTAFEALQRRSRSEYRLETELVVRESTKQAAPHPRRK